MSRPPGVLLFPADRAEGSDAGALARSLHRRTDSAGSRAAARATAAGGALAEKDAAVLEAARRHPWGTSAELYAAEAEFLSRAGVGSREEVARRLPRLLERGQLARIDPDRYPTVRPCRVSGTPCFRWALASEPGAEEWLEARPASPAAVAGETAQRSGSRDRGQPRGRRRSPARGTDQGARVGVGCELCEGRGWVLGASGVAHPCTCRK